jgi:zinc/manganese transport system ATP-binding protein
MSNVIELEQVSLGWRDRVALRDVSGAFAQGSLTAIVGPNGAGKSTLLKSIMGALAPLRGRIRILGGRGELAFLPQAAQLDRHFPISVYDMVALGAWRRVGAWRGFGQDEHQRVLAALETVGLADFSARMVATLSGGQMQRALFARLMLHDAQILLLDEPFNTLDSDTTADLLALIQQWHAQGRTVLAVLHDLDMVRASFAQTLLLARQVVAWGETAQVLTADNLHQARHLCAGDYI